ncbi:MAG TPA: zinc-dependent metalloprotease [Gemmatimonadales bacterium]|nr:zinc-dependent metalloprotease [Gemmatimonadales bacterium]
MDATRVDWSMGSQAARLADWDTALAVGRRVAGPGVPVVAADRARMREDFAEVVTRSETLIVELTALDPGGFRSRPWVMGRGEWIRANLHGLQRMLEPLAGRILAKQPAGRGTIRRTALGAQAGALLGYVSRRVLGQYDAFLPPDDEGLLYFVGPNIAEVERRFALPQRDFRLWVALHEVTHRVQFGAAPWLRSHIREQVDRYLGTISLDSKELGQQLRRAIDEARSGSDVRGMGALFLLLTPEQREIVRHVQGVMSLLEGHASYVMNEAGRGEVDQLERMRRSLAERRRRAGGLERSFQRAIGFDKKIEQYDAGERFVREVVSRSGMDGFNRVWLAPEALPTVDEIAAPSSWVARVAGS